MKEIYLLLAYKTSRGSSGSGGRLFPKSVLFDRRYIKDLTAYGNTLKFAELGGYFDLMKTMTVEQFEQYFTPQEIVALKPLLDYDSAEGFSKTMFRQEIHTKYGVDASAENAKKHVCKSGFRAGGIYLDKDNKTQWLYMGNVRFTYQFNDKQVEYAGNMFVNWSRFSDRLSHGWVKDLSQFIADIIRVSEPEKVFRTMFLKGYKKVICEVDYVGGEFDFMLNRQIDFVSPPNMIYSYVRKGYYIIST